MNTVSLHFCPSFRFIEMIGSSSTSVHAFLERIQEVIRSKLSSIGWRCYNSKTRKIEAWQGVFPTNFTHILWTIEQARPTVIKVNETDCQKRVAIKCVKTPHGFAQPGDNIHG